MANIAPPPQGRPSAAPEPSAAAAAGAAAAALLQRQLAEDSGPKGGDKASGWSEHQTGDGRKFFFNEETQTSTWEKPEVLMTAEERKNDTPWREYRIWDGRVFYHNRETKVSCWSMPPEIRRLRGESSGIDETPLPQTSAERRRAFWDQLREHGCDDTWSWTAVEEAVSKLPQAQDVPVEVRKQCFVELVAFCKRQKEIEAREKQRNAASALERLIEERFGNPEDLGTSYEEAASLLEKEEPWQLIKSDVRRDEVFQNVMERLEEKHAKSRTEKRADQAIRLQRLVAADAELKRPRLRWKDAAAIMAKRDELHEEDPPLEALRVWASLRDIKPASEHEHEAKRRMQTEAQIREERKRRDAFIAVLRELTNKNSLSREMAWSDLEGLVKESPAFLGLKEGPGATAPELFDEFQEDLARGLPLEEAGLTFEVDLAIEPPVPPPPALYGDGVKNEMRSIKNEAHEPAAKRAKIEAGVRPPPPPPIQPGMVQTKQEIMAKAPGLVAAKTETQEPSPLDTLLAAADAMKGAAAPDQPVSTPLTKEELMEPGSRPAATAKAASAAKEEMADTGGSDPLAVPSVPQSGMPRVIAPKKAAAPAPPAAEAPIDPAIAALAKESLPAVKLMSKKVDELRELCRARGLPTSGRKQELVDRLAAG